MSLILEALRKSEAERQRGRAPGLFVEQAARSQQPRGVPGWAWVLGVLLVGVVLAWGWREWTRATGPLAMDAATATTPDAVSPAATSTAPAPAAVAVALAPAPAPAAPLPVPAPVSRPAATVPAPATEPAVAAPPPTPASEAIGAPPPAPVVEAPPFVPSLSSLAASERAQLPPLKLSMHVFADAPAQRFVILDGQRLGEGASPAAGLVVEEIRRDGLVLSVNGQRFVLARP